MHLWSSWNLRDSAEGALHKYCCCKPFLYAAFSSFQALTAPFLASRRASRLTCHLKNAATSELTSAYSANFIHNATAEFFESPQTFLSNWGLEMNMTNIWCVQIIKKNKNCETQFAISGITRCKVCRKSCFLLQREQIWTLGFQLAKKYQGDAQISWHSYANFKEEILRVQETGRHIIHDEDLNARGMWPYSPVMRNSNMKGDCVSGFRDTVGIDVPA